MGVYGRNGRFAASPIPQHRQGWHKTNAVIPQFAPVMVVDGAEPDGNGRLEVELATDSNGKPLPNVCGVAVYEVPPRYYSNVDPLLTTPSDIIDIPAGVAIQMVHGTEVIMELVNTDDFSFDGQTSQAGRIMVGGLGATPTLNVGDFIKPGPGDDSGGYWQETSDEDEAWAVVVQRTIVEGNLGRSETLAVVQANLLF